MLNDCHSDSVSNRVYSALYAKYAQERISWGTFGSRIEERKFPSGNHSASSTPPFMGECAANARATGSVSLYRAY